MLTVNEIRALCDAAGLELDSNQILPQVGYADIYTHDVERGRKVHSARGTAVTEDEAILAAWENYVNNQRD